MPKTDRYLSFDVARGLIMIVMAIDHAFGPWVADYHLPEIVLPGLPFTFAGYPDAAKHFSRVLTHICAPGFQFLAGLGMAISICRATAAGAPQWRLSLDMLLRGLVLIGLEWLVMAPVYGGVPLLRPWLNPFLFLVLCCIGSSTILFSVLRFLPLPLLALASFAVLLAAPLYCPTALTTPTGEGYLLNIWTRIAPGPPGTWWQVMYPILPWVGCFGLGWCLGARHVRGPLLPGKNPETQKAQGLPAAGTALLGLAMIALGVILRWAAGTYGDQLGGDAPPWTASFWLFSKYPPSPAFLFIFLGANVLLVGLLRPLDRQEPPSSLWELAAVFGRVALFFFIVHFWLYNLAWFFFVGPANVAATPLDQMDKLKFPLVVGYGVWLMGLILLWPVCLGYGRLRARYRTLLRYF